MKIDSWKRKNNSFVNFVRLKILFENQISRVLYSPGIKLVEVQTECSQTRARFAKDRKDPFRFRNYSNFSSIAILRNGIDKSDIETR